MLHLFIRLVLAYLYAEVKRPFNHPGNAKIAVIIPTYNEEARHLSRCVESVRRQRGLPNIRIIVVDDGSLVPVEPIEGAEVIRVKHGGKKAAIAAALETIGDDTEYVTLIDSDSYLQNTYTLGQLLGAFDEKTGIVCGRVALSSTASWTNKLVQFLYWNAFCIWRAGSSFLGQVAVCSGALTVFRMTPSYTRKLLRPYFERDIKYGEDRFMTFLFLNAGWKARYSENAVVVTDGPSGWKFIRQQVRWNQSFWRGLCYSWPLYLKPRHAYYFTLDMFLKAISRIITIAVFFVALWLIAKGSFLSLGFLLAGLMVYGLIHSIPGLVRTRRIAFLGFALWALISVFVIAPVNLYALATLRRNHWGTR